MSYINKISGWINQLNYDNVKGLCFENAKKSIIDACGCALAASSLKISKIVEEYVIETGCSSENVIIGSPYKANPLLAGFVNGVLVHALDYDETNYSAISHPSAVLFPTVLACGEKIDAGGLEVLTAYVAGFEVEAKLGIALNPHLYKKGWFTTSVLGVVGSAAAASKLLGLNEKQIEHALCLSISQAAGLLKNNGTMVKPYAAGKAVENGIASALLAEKGIETNVDIFEGFGGFVDLFNDGKFAMDSLDGLGEKFEIVDPGVVYKNYPTCSALHASIDAMLEILSKNIINIEDVENITCEVTDLVNKSIRYDIPQTFEQAQFSMKYCLAFVLANKNFNINHLLDSNFNDQEISKVIDLISVVPSPEIEMMGIRDRASEATRLTINFKSGKSIQKYVAQAKNLDNHEIENKYIENAHKRLTPGQIKESMDMFGKLEQLRNIKELSRVLASDYGL